MRGMAGIGEGVFSRHNAFCLMRHSVGFAFAMAHFLKMFSFWEAKGFLFPSYLNIYKQGYGGDGFAIS